MKHYLDTHLYVALILFTLAAAAVAGAFVAHVRTEHVRSTVEERVIEKDRYMLELAELTDRNGADEMIAAIIPECDRRADYEALLVQLADLGKKDLLSLQSLFDACGAFDAQRKALMVAKLDREFESYRTLNALLQDLGEDELARMPIWEDLVKHEKLRSSLLMDLYAIQKGIISALIVGTSSSGDTVRTMAANAQDMSELLAVYDRTVDEARARLSQ